MNLKKTTKEALPTSIKIKLSNFLRKKDNLKFKLIKSIECDTTMLKSINNLELDKILNNNEIDSSWKNVEKSISSFDIPDFTGGVNPGDRKAIFYLIKYFNPSTVLEIGTHIGASTINIATALLENQLNQKTKSVLKTVDIRDVNSISKKPWLEYGTKTSPIEMIKGLKCQENVEFIISTSITYMESNKDRFDFIFLDGDHSASTVYKEIPLALKKLNKNGVILLHDFFPNGNPLWSDNSIIKGPFMAVNRLILEGAKIEIRPLGNLPWATKLGSKTTSLALLLKKD